MGSFLRSFFCSAIFPEPHAGCQDTDEWTEEFLAPGTSQPLTLGTSERGQIRPRPLPASPPPADDLSLLRLRRPMVHFCLYWVHLPTRMSPLRTGLSLVYFASGYRVQILM